MPTIAPTPLTGRAIPTTLLGRFRRASERVYVVSPFLEDYEFRPLSRLGDLLARQVDDGASVRLLTCPPAGRASEVRRKRAMLESFERRGVDVHVNTRLHAKIYLFMDSRRQFAMVGSANMTTGGMEKHVELALLSMNADLGRRLEANVAAFLSMPETQNFRRWKLDNPVSEATGGTVN